MNYDSTAETQKHIDRVRFYLDAATTNLVNRARVHDDSKLQSPEKEAFDRLGPPEVMAALEYGSEAYKAQLRTIKPAIQHHYSVNTHHPEHWSNGVDGMSLLDLVEMLCDWKAAGERHTTGSIAASLEKNQERFKVSPQLQAILSNTAKELGWM